MSHCTLNYLTPAEFDSACSFCSLEKIIENLMGKENPYRRGSLRYFKHGVKLLYYFLSTYFQRLKGKLQYQKKLFAEYSHFAPIIKKEKLALKAARKQINSYHENPLISVVIPTYNRSDILLNWSVASVLKQTYQNFELLVIGDHCTDDTEGQLVALNDPRIRFYNLPARPPYPQDSKSMWCVTGTYARSKATEIFRGKWVAQMDDDVIFEPDHLESLLRYAQEHNCEVVFAKEKFEYRRGEWRITGRALDTLKRDPNNNSPHHATIVRDYVYRIFKHSPESWRIGWVHDRHWRWRLYKAGVHAGFLDKVVTISPLRPNTTVQGWGAEDRPM